MCGRFTLASPRQEVLDHYGIDSSLPLLPRYNIAPSQDIAAVRQGDEGRELVLLRWGLVPHWAKEEKSGYSMINARAETVASRPAFRNPFRHRRCLIPADGFYEWRKADGKQPYRFTVGGAVFSFAGLWEHWKGAEGEVVESCTIVVTGANELVGHVHDRMPVIVDPADYERWLDPGITDSAMLAPLLAPFPAGRMQGYPVSRRINKADYHDPAAIEPVGSALKV